MMNLPSTIPFCSFCRSDTREHTSTSSTPESPSEDVSQVCHSVHSHRAVQRLPTMIAMIGRIPPRRDPLSCSAAVIVHRFGDAALKQTQLLVAFIMSKGFVTVFEIIPNKINVERMRTFPVHERPPVTPTEVCSAFAFAVDGV